VTEPFDQGNDGEFSTLQTFDRSTEDSLTHRKAKVTEKATEKATETSSGSNDFLKLDPATRGPSNDKLPDSQGEPKIYSDSNDPSYAGMKIVPLNPDANISSNAPKSSSAIGTTAITDKAGVTDKVWKDTPLDDISRSGAPGAGPRAPEHLTPATPDTSKTSTTASTSTAIGTTAPDSVKAAGTYESAAPKVSGADAAENSRVDSEKASASRDTPGWTSTGVASDSNTFDPAARSSVMGEPKSTLTQQAGHILSSTDDVAGLVGETTPRQSESHKSPELGSSPSNDEHNSKMSSLKEKMKNKLHIGSKDK
jgi:hypothetical protein